MKNIISIISIFLLISCTKKNETKKPIAKETQKVILTNDFDEILHFTVSEEIEKKNKNNQTFQDIYSNLDDMKIDLNTFEKQLSDLGFTFEIISESKIKSVLNTITNDINLKYHEVACVPFYNDIFIFKKTKKPVAALKVCFECGMNETIGVISSNFDTENKNKFSDYSVLYTLLYNKEYDQRELHRSHF